MRQLAAVAAIASCLMIGGANAEDGARAYFLLPTGTNDFELTTTIVHTELNGTVVDSATLTPSYRHTFDIMGDAGTFLIGFPVGALSGTIHTPFGDFPASTNPAPGDFFIGGTLGIVGAPALSPMQYAQYQAGLQVSVSTRLFLPTGDYNSARPLNLGGNRWSLQTNLPISYVLGGSLVNPQLTTLEIMPSVQIFGDNPDSPGSHAVTSQAPLYGLEGHVTHNFSPMVWVSADAYGLLGGETTIGGVAQGDSQQSVSLGGTLGLTFSPSFAVRLSYDRQVYSKAPSSAGSTAMATAAFLF